MTKKMKINKNKKVWVITLVGIILLALDLSSSQVNFVTDTIEQVMAIFTEETVEIPEVSGDYELGQVTRIVDGDTLMVQIEGTEQKVRLIGIDTPESVGQYKDNPEYYGPEASQFTKDQLLGKEVYLVKDESDTDRYGRLLRYIWFEEPKEGVVSEDMYNAILLLGGYASVMNISPDVKYAEVFKEYEAAAKVDAKGMWEAVGNE